MPSTLSPVDYCNAALAKVGASPINSLLDTSNTSAIACNTAFNLCYLEVSRSGQWNCLLKTAVLPSIPQTPISGTSGAITATPWAPKTAYLANAYVSFGGYYYLVLINYTSSANILNDITQGFLSQTDQVTGSDLTDFQGLQALGDTGLLYPSGWAYQYQLPSDFQLMGVLNGQASWDSLGADFDGTGSDEYEIMGPSLFCDEQSAVIQYVSNVPDTTQWDSLFGNAFTLKLASAISTKLRQDAGRMEQAFLQGYEAALRKARTANGNEQTSRRFNPITTSRFNQARYGGSNG